VDAAKNFMDSLANAIAETGTNTNIKDTIKLDIPIESIYVDADGNIVVVNTNPDGSISETVLTPNGELNNTVVQDADGNVYVVDEQGKFNTEPYAYEITNRGDDMPLTREEAEEKLADLVVKLKNIIKEKYGNKNDEFPKYAYDNLGNFPQVNYDYNYTIIMANGLYDNGTITITPLGIRQENENDIISTLYHEYMHYLNDIKSIFPYRKDLNGNIFQIKDECYEQRMETDKNFYERVSELYCLANPLEDIPISFEDFTKELLDILDIFAEREKMTKEIRCFSYTYMPSNYFRDEINAYMETEKAHHNGLFNTSERKLNEDKKTKAFYELKLEQSIKYENNNNYNTIGYENK
jgi:hypothetical protein